MKYSKWLAFGVSSQQLQARLHLLPFCKKPVAPYTTLCKLSAFGSNLTPTTTRLDGVRLGQPATFSLNEIFPALQSFSGVYGLLIEISSAYPDVDLSSASCIVELGNEVAGTVQFNAQQLVLSPAYAQGATERISGEDRYLAPLVGIQDPYQSTSLLVINCTDKSWKPEFKMMLADRSFVTPTIGHHLDDRQDQQMVLPGQIAEIPCEVESFYYEQPTSYSWGLLRKQAIYLKQPPSNWIALYAVYRDAMTKRPISIQALSNQGTSEQTTSNYAGRITV